MSFVGQQPGSAPATQQLGDMAFQNAKGLVVKPRAGATPHQSGDMVFELVDDNNLKIRYRGLDGVLRDAVTLNNGVTSTQVSVTGNQAVAGIKTFSSAPVVPANASGLQAVAAQETVRMVGGAARLPSWTTAGRPASPGGSDIGKNTTLNCIEYWNGTYWVAINGLSYGPRILSGNIYDITSIPAWVNHIDLSGYNVSLSGTNNLLIQLIDTKPAAVTTGYAAAGGNFDGSASAVIGSTSGFPVRIATAAVADHFNMTLRRVGDYWVCSGAGHFGAFDSPLVFGGRSGSIGDITGIRIRASSADTFDAGAVSVTFRG